MHDPNIHYLHPRVDKLETLVHGLDKKADKLTDSFDILIEKINKIEIALQELKRALVKEKRKRKLTGKIFNYIWKLMHSPPLGYLSMGLLILCTSGKDNVLIAFIQAVIHRNS